MINIKLHNDMELYKKYWMYVKPYFIRKYGKGLILDIGCGNHGYWIEGYEYIGIDIVYKNKNIVADAHNLPFRDNVFDTILLFDILEHSTMYGLIINEAIRVAKENAYYLISVPYGDLKSAETDNSHRHTYTVKTLTQALEYHGLKVIEIHRYCPLLDNIICIAV